MKESLRKARIAQRKQNTERRSNVVEKTKERETIDNLEDKIDNLPHLPS